MYCSQCGQENSDTAALCHRCQQPLYRVTAEQFKAMEYSTNSMGGLIPYRNAPALVAYYTGLFSICPFLGAPLVIVAYIAGYMGLKKAKEHPEAKGKVHAWVGIACAVVGTLINGLVVAGLITALTR